jgi:hypothetical protein
MLAQRLTPVILGIGETDIRKIKDHGQPRLKYSETPSQPIKKLSMVTHACDASYAGSLNQRITVWASLGIKVRPYLKTN